MGNGAIVLWCLVAAIVVGFMIAMGKFWGEKPRPGQFFSWWVNSTIWIIIAEFVISALASHGG